MRSFALLFLCSCQLAFPIASSEGGTDAQSPPEAGVWCGDGQPRCAGESSGTKCCVAQGNGYELSCADAADPCARATFVFECDHPEQCPQRAPFCCYYESNPDGGYRAESRCASSCSAFDRMCAGPSASGCPPSMSCLPWFSGYFDCR